MFLNASRVWTLTLSGLFLQPNTVVKTGLFVRSFHWRCTRSYQIENEDTKTGYKIELQRDMQVTTVSDIV